uniref:Phosphate transporter n=1 Tax=Kwoniella bestiolae CBS 10118 TaxID=1296100 RepID=A0A1B9G3A0_9TREE|nr:solute carrier family 20 (sodium-dependent phosphate transporter) [Kwoniella bestiolae CBS 10118]OCF25505.1 solute carrier family 20 (sodium-dependent phosphate transporter) [Kwoniella bestiolae CBS 10118]
MPYLHQYDYIFAIAILFAALDAFNIGANDVANSFATSVSSRSLTLRQACLAAALMEFLGAVLVGAKVAGTIKNGIISLSAFQGNAGVEMLGFTCALVASATWLMIATRNSWPVSTTYSIVSALAGVGVAIQGKDAVQWGWNNAKGIGAIFAGFIIAPGISAGFAAVVYLITKYAVLERKNSIRAGMMIAPVYFFTVAAVLTMSIVYKGAPSLKLDKLSKTTIALAIVLTGLVVAILSILFWLPYVHAKVVKKDYTIRWYHFFYGPLLWKRPAPTESLEHAHQHVPDYRVLGRDDEKRTYEGETGAHPSNLPIDEDGSPTGGRTKNLDPERDLESSPTRPHKPVPLEEVEVNPKTQIEGLWILPRNLWVILRYKIPKILLHGSSVDVHAMQAGNGSKQANRIHEMHERASQYPNETEHMYSFLQVLTACTNSFAHGSNDVANAVGPFAAVYYVWSHGQVTPKDTPTPTWILAFGGAMIVIGLATYGYNIMAVLGNKLTMHSPSRGFSMEFGAAITVLLASQYGIPVSTTMCITGATMGVGVLSSGFKGVNWRALGWIFLGWVLTVPVAGVAAGCLMGIILNAPHF